MSNPADPSSADDVQAALREALERLLAPLAQLCLAKGMPFAVVEEMLKRPEFVGVEPRPIKGMIGDAIARGDAEFGGGALTEILMAKDVEPVGRFPDDLGLHVDMAAAVLKISTAPSDAENFLRYVTRPEAAPVWKEGGVIETPKK